MSQEPMNTNEVPYGFCQCGCGQKTPLAVRSRCDRGQVKGEPIRFCWGHQGKKYGHLNIPPEHKVCGRCREIKPYGDFWLDGNTKDGRQGKCKVCSAEVGLLWREKNRQKTRDYSSKTRFRKEFGITIEEYHAMAAQQSGVCLICQNKNVRRACRDGSDSRLAVDHCHKTGKVRGLLCSNCNNGLGHFKDDISRLEAAIAYLKKHQ